MNAKWSDLSVEAIVVGAGPAGAVAAHEIARAGFSVLLVEKHDCVGVPVCCAGGITVEGLTRVVPLDPRWVATEIAEVLMAAPGGQTILFRHPAAGFILNRQVFDHDLAQRAAQAGATIWIGTEAVGLTSENGRTFDSVLLRRDGAMVRVGCRVVLGCDGIESLVGRWAGMNTIVTAEDMDSSAQYLLSDLSDIVPGRVEFYFSSRLTPGGYAWVFPKGAATANVGIGFCPALGDGRHARERLDEFVSLRFGHGKILERMAGGVPAFCGRKLMVTKNVLLAGDAARLLDSLSGAGIANALLSGQFAGRTAAEYLRQKEPKLSLLRNYPDRFMKIKGRELRCCRLARQIFLRMTDADLEDVLALLGPLYDGKTIHHIDGVEIIKHILRTRPRLLALTRHLIW